MMDPSKSGIKFHGAGSAPDAPAVLYVFGEAGTGSASWGWLGAHVQGLAEVRAVRLAGRESRYHEPPADSIAGQVDDLLPDFEELVRKDGRPYALVGSCSGAVTAYELLRAAQQQPDVPGPAYLAVVNQRTPAESGCAAAPVHDFDEERFREWCTTALRGQVDLRRPDVYEFFADTLRADFSAVSTYVPEPGQLLRCPVVAVCGDTPDDLSVQQISGWAAVGADGFHLRVLSGLAKGEVLGAEIARLARAVVSGLDSPAGESEQRH